MKKYLLSCDWGTSSFRLKLIATTNHAVIGEIVSKNGVADTFNVWREKGVQLMPRREFFKQHLKDQIDLLSNNLDVDLSEIPVVMSGMASSSIGMHEIPYAKIPFSLDGSDVLIHYIEGQTAFPHDIFLISGVRSDHDVMRGEETQLIGLNELVNMPDNRDAIFIFPGTHSKHMYVENGKLVDFKTFMTGEIFNLMANHSILKDSVELYRGAGFQVEALDSFKAGVRESGTGFILNSLFTVRTNQLFDLLNKKQNGMYLSGLLIGSEVRYLIGERAKQLVLCSGNNLFGLYQTAIEELGLTENTVTVPSEIVDKAATAAHIRIFESQKLTLNKSES